MSDVSVGRPCDDCVNGECTMNCSSAVRVGAEEEKKDLLKPCPFCGCNDAFVMPPTCKRGGKFDLEDRVFPLIRCLGCYCEVPGKNWDASGDSAIDAWNSRAPTAPPNNDDAALLESLRAIVAEWKVSPVFSDVVAFAAIREVLEGGC